MKWGGEAKINLRDLCIDADASLLDAMKVLERGGEAIAFVCDAGGRVIGSLTDGDIRRALLRGSGLDERCLRSAMQPQFIHVSPDASRAEVLDIMMARDIGQLPALDPDGRLVGLHTIGRLLTARSRPNWVVLMAGGRGARLKPLTDSLPKPMMRVAGRPILERLILHLMSGGFERFFISVNYMGEVIERHFGDGSRLGCQIEYLRETRPLGTGGSLSLLPQPDTATLVLNGDLVTDSDFGKFVDFHEGGGYAATVGVRSHSVNIPFGVTQVRDGRLVALEEKPTQTMLINAGMYVLSPQALELVEKKEEFPITDLLQRCLSRGLPVGAHTISDEWIDVGQPGDLRRARGED